MYGAPFYSMPFTYPPSSTGAQMAPEQAAGVTAGVVERKSSDADGEPKLEGEDSEPVRYCPPFCSSKAFVVPRQVPCCRYCLRCPPRMLLIISTVAPDVARYSSRYVLTGVK